MSVLGAPREQISESARPGEQDEFYENDDSVKGIRAVEVKRSISTARDPKTTLTSMKQRSLKSQSR